METVPGVSPVTLPVLPTEATAAALLLQAPPVVASLKMVLVVWHRVARPVIGATVGVVSTVITLVSDIEQPSV